MLFGCYNAIVAVHGVCSTTFVRYLCYSIVTAHVQIRNNII
jgi:hypothetical protein